MVGQKISDVICVCSLMELGNLTNYVTITNRTSLRVAVTSWVGFWSIYSGPSVLVEPGVPEDHMWSQQYLTVRGAKTSLLKVS